MGLKWIDVRNGFSSSSKGKQLRYLSYLLILFLLLSCKRDELNLYIPITNLPYSYDPIMINEYYSNLVNRNIFETLIKRERNNYFPILVDYWHNTNEHQTILKIRNDIKFSDGYPLTVEDVEKSLYRALNHPNSTYKGMVVIDSIISTSSNFIYIYNQSIDLIVQFLCSVPIYKAQYIDSFSEEYLQFNPLSTGEYYLYSENSSEIILKKNRFHHNYDKRNLLRTPDIVHLVLESSLDNQYQMFKAQKVDLMLQVPLTVYRDVSLYEEIDSFIQTSNTIVYMMFDKTNDSLFGIKDISTQTDELTQLTPINPLKDKRVRQAIVHAIDTNFFINHNLMGRANLLVIPALSSFSNYPHEMKYYRHDIEFSKSLLAEAGYPHGLEINIRVKDNLFCNELASYIKESLEQINIKIKIENINQFDFLQSLKDDPVSVFITDYEVDYNENYKEMIFNLFYYTPQNRGHLNIYNNYNSQINSLIDSLLVMREYDRRVYGTSNRLSNLIFDETVVIPFINTFNFSIYRSTNSLNYAEKFLFSDFRFGK